MGQIVRGKTEEEVLKNARTRAREHGFHETTPELIAMITANIVDQKKEQSHANA